MKSTILSAFLILIAMIGLSACSSIPSLGPGEVTKVWHVHPDDMAQFRMDQGRCSASATGLKNADLYADACLQRIGYKLEVVSQ